MHVHTRRASISISFFSPVKAEKTYIRANIRVFGDSARQRSKIYIEARGMRARARDDDEENGERGGRARYPRSIYSR